MPARKVRLILEHLSNYGLGSSLDAILEVNNDSYGLQPSWNPGYVYLSHFKHGMETA